MGKPTGFLEIERREVQHQAPVERISHWNEFHEPMADAEIREQAARCMDCGVPFCHTGIQLSTGASGCPVNNLIPDWNDMLYNDQWEEALRLLLKTNNFPEFTGRVCPAPCEGSCVLGIHEPPVTIKNHEYSIIEHAFAQGWIKPQPPEKRTGKAVAVIGSGPAGLAAADELNKMGHSVTVIERDDRPGGLLMYGIPNMKLDKNAVVQRRIRIMEEEGVEFKLNTALGIDVSLNDLRSEFHAVVLATGSTIPRDLTIPGRSAKGIYFAMEFLKMNTKSLLDSELKDGKYINAHGKKVIVIGGGDTGTDCVATALRHQCESVTQLEILPRPTESRTAQNPWPEYPLVYKLDYGQEEAKALQGEDPRQYCVMTKEFKSDEQGRLNGISIVDVDWIEQNGRKTPKEIEGSERLLEADLVLLAMGFVGPEKEAIEQSIEFTDHGNINAHYGQFTTSINGVFAAGDCRRGQSLVVWAINEGRGAALACDKYLRDL